MQLSPSASFWAAVKNNYCNTKLSLKKEAVLITKIMGRLLPFLLIPVYFFLRATDLLFSLERNLPGPSPKASFNHAVNPNQKQTLADRSAGFV